MHGRHAHSRSTEFWISYVEGFFGDDDGFFSPPKLRICTQFFHDNHTHLVSMALPRFGMKISKYHDSDISAASSHSLQDKQQSNHKTDFHLQGF